MAEPATRTFVVERTLKYRFTVTTDLSNERPEKGGMSPFEEKMFKERHRGANYLAREVADMQLFSSSAINSQLMSASSCVYPVEETNGVRRF